MKKIFSMFLAAMLTTTVFAGTPPVYADNRFDVAKRNVDSNGYSILGGVKSYSTDGSIVTVEYDDGNKLRVSFLSSEIIRYYVDIDDHDFLDFAKPNSSSHEGQIVAQSDAEFIAEHGVVPTVSDEGGKLVMTTDSMKIEIDKDTSKLKITKADGTVVLQEAAPLMFKGNETVQSLVENSDEYFYGGGTQNGRFSHKGEDIKIENTNNWVDGGVASPNPFYWSTKGYGVVRNTFQKGLYDFGKKTPGVVQTKHSEARFDSYIFIGDNPEALLDRYTDVTGKPEVIPDYAFYLSHLNCYNRDEWREVEEGKTSNIKIDGKYYTEHNNGGAVTGGGVLESLMPKGNNYTFTAKKQIDLHEENDMPLGWFLPNDGYSCNYGQTDTFEGDIKELKAFTDFANSKGVETGLWTQANLWPEDINNPKKGERDVKKEVFEAGIRAIKTDVAWVGAGYSMALDGVKKTKEAIAEFANAKSAIVSLDGWAGTQRYGGIWSGDQVGGNWEYIRFHIPTYITTGLSGNPYIGSDMDGIWGGKNPVIQTRDFQWKAFTPYMLDMDGWGSSQKNPWEFGEPYASINRAYLKDKAEIMPYIATMSNHAGKTGMPLVRAMLFEEQNAYTLGKSTQYQYMWGDSFLVAPIYQNTASDENGNDIRNGIYLPGTTDIWIDYLTGEQYRGGSVLNGYEAPIWKTPVFVKNGTILPRYAENNNPRPITTENPKGLDKSQRIVEVYPYGETSFTLYEDDGITLDGKNIETVINSIVKDGVATLSIDKATGTYDNIVADRSNEVIFNVSKAPEKVTGKVNGLDVVFNAVATLEEYEAATGNVYFYNENPDTMISKYATEGSVYDTERITKRPQVLVKSTEKTSIFTNDFEVSVHGFENSYDLGDDVVNNELQVPTNIEEVEVTPTTFEIKWDSVANAVTYDVEIDGTIHSNITEANFKLGDLPYDTPFEVKVRSVNKDGYSEWTEIFEIRTSLDPYRNVPKDMVATYSQNGGYAGKPQDALDLDTGTEFHSNGGAKGQYFTVDMQKAYEIEKVTYVPRQDNFGNGTLQQFEFEYSVDGKTWRKNATVDSSNEWTWPSSQQDELITKDIPFEDSFSARYVRIKVNKSKGDFFTIRELFIYKKDGSKGSIVGDITDDGVVDEGDFTFFTNYSGLREGDADFGYISNVGADFNLDGVIDAFDIGFVGRQVNGGAAVNNNPVKGSMKLEASQPDAKAGDVVTYTLYGLNMSDVYAFGMEVDLDADIHGGYQDGVSTAQASAMASYFTNFSQARNHTNGKRNNYMIFTLAGEQKRLAGTGAIAEFTIKFKQDVESTDLNIVKGEFIGSNLSTVNGIVDEEPKLPETEKILSFSDIKAMKLKNNLITEDDGTYYDNVFQSKGAFETLFNGKLSDAAEFKWDTVKWNTPHDGKDIILPMDFIFELKQPEPVKTVKWYNRIPSSNGTVTEMYAKAYSGDIEYDLGTLTGTLEVFEFEVPEGAGLIDRVIFTPVKSNGVTSINTDPSTTNRMLTVREVEIITDSETLVDVIEFGDIDTVYLDELTLVPVTVTPDKASNKLYTVTSTDESVASIIKIKTATSYEYYIKGHKAGDVQITATSLANPNVTVTKTITITDEINTDELLALYNEAISIVRHLYTDEALKDLDKLLVKVESLLENSSSTEDVIKATVELEMLLTNLEFKGSDSTLEDSVNLLDSDSMEVVDYSSFADKDYAEHILDKDPDTFWHSSYQAAAKLPVHITVDLGDAYMLEQVDMLARQNGRNGDITRYRIEVSVDGSTFFAVDQERSFAPIVQGEFANDGYSLTQRDQAKKVKFAPVEARYVKFIALNTLGAENDKYASIAELTFYGLPKSDIIFADSIEFGVDSLDKFIGETFELTPTINPQEANESLTWKSSDETVATVDELGNVTTHKVGVATITVTGRDAEASIEVNVLTADVTQLVEVIKVVEERLDNEAFVETLHPSLLDALNKALDVAKAIVTDPSVYTPDEVIEAHDALIKANKDLDENVHFVKFEDYKNTDLSIFDTTTINEYETLIAEAKDLEVSIDNIDVIKELNSKFEAAAQKLVKLNKTKLEMTVEIFRDVNLDKYTEQSRNMFTTALEDALTALDSATTNAELDAAYDALVEAFNDLTPITGEEPGDNEKPEEPGDIDKPGNPGDTEKPGNPGEELPGTGFMDTNVYIAMSLLTAGIYLILKSKKRYNN